MAIRYIRVPLEPVPQRFSIELGGRGFVMVNRWNDVVGAWFLDIFDEKTQAPLVLSMPLVTGVDLLRQYRHVGIEGALIVFTSSDPLAMPTFENIGTEGQLAFVVDQ